MAKRATFIEQVKVMYAMRIARPTPTQVMMESFSKHMSLMMGAVSRPKLDPFKCIDCGHHMIEHTDKPHGYGCVKCLCLRTVWTKFYPLWLDHE